MVTIETDAGGEQSLPDPVAGAIHVRPADDADAATRPTEPTDA
jgi:hypothetical protein